MKILSQILLLLLLAISISSCKLMPYRSDFDCPIPEGIKCKSLYEVNKMADLGMFDPNKQDNIKICYNKNINITKPLISVSETVVKLRGIIMLVLGKAGKLQLVKIQPT